MNYSFHDVNQAYPFMQELVAYHGVEEETRNGKVKAMPVPVLLTHSNPERRVLFDAKRDCNPFFHYMESIWMLAGSENVDFPAHFAKQIRQYSDDGVTLHGAYGYRWRVAFERDQIESTIAQLAKDHHSRRLVIGMWDPHLDMERDGKDLPCNTQLYFRVVDGRLTMTILNRSNDLVWGMLGANIVHMSILQEFVAGSVGLPVGPMYQFSNNVHVYEGWGGDDKIAVADTWYSNNHNYLRWAFNDRNLAIHEAQHFVENMDEEPFESRIMRDNVMPMFRCHTAYKEGDLDLALHLVKHIYDEDWQRACRAWLHRRVK